MESKRVFDLTKEEVLEIVNFEGEAATVQVDLEPDLIKEYQEHADRIGVDLNQLLSAVVMIYCRELTEKDKNLLDTN
jgi:hypothetical protein